MILFQKEVSLINYFIDRRLKIVNNQSECFSNDNDTRKKKIFEFLTIFKQMKLPLWAYYIRIISNYSNDGLDKEQNTCLKLSKYFLRILFIIFVHAVLFLYFSVENFFVFVVLVNEAILVIGECRTFKEKQDEELEKINSVKELKQYKEQENEVMFRGKKCLKRWMLFLLYILVKRRIEQIQMNRYYFIVPKIIYIVYITS